MQCDTIQILFSAYLDGEIGDSDRRALEGHLDACAACTGELAALRGSVRLLRALMPEEPPAELRPRILAAIGAARPSAWHRLAALFRMPQAAPGWSLAGAGLAATIAVGVYSFRPASDAPSVSTGPKPPVVAQNVTRPVAKTVRKQGPRKPVTVVARAPRVTEKTADDAGKRAAAALASTEPARGEPRVAKATAKAPRRLRLAIRPKPAPLPAAERRDAPRPAVKPTRERGGPTTPGPTSPGAFEGFEPTPPRVAATPPSPPVDTLPEEPMTMMASMPMVSSGSPMEPGSGSGDALAALRRRLAEQRREAPPAAVDPPASRRDARTLPVRIEF